MDASNARDRTKTMPTALYSPQASSEVGHVIQLEMWMNAVVLDSMDELCSGSGRYDGKNEMMESSQTVAQSTHSLRTWGVNDINQIKSIDERLAILTVLCYHSLCQITINTP